jgi:predicted component of type VI protein secretion system
MKLVIEDEAGTRSVVPFTGDAIVVGRGAEGVTFRLADRDVSRRHARFLRQSGAVFVEDLGSLTGTRVNGERIGGRRRLRDGDLVQIGDYDLALLEDGAEAGTGAPPPLPAPSRTDLAAVAVPAVAPPPEATPEAIPDASPAPLAAPARGPAPRSGRGRVVVRALLVGAVALGLGLVAGWLAGASLTPP